MGSASFLVVNPFDPLKISVCLGTQWTATYRCRPMKWLTSSRFPSGVQQKTIFHSRHLDHDLSELCHRNPREGEPLQRIPQETYRGKHHQSTNENSRQEDREREGTKVTHGETVSQCVSTRCLLRQHQQLRFGSNSNGSFWMYLCFWLPSTMSSSVTQCTGTKVG